MKTRSFANLIASACAAGAGLALAALAGCTVQPIGWQGAGRMQELPQIQMDAGGAMIDSGADVDAGFDSGVFDTGSSMSSGTESTETSSSGE